MKPQNGGKYSQMSDKGLLSKIYKKFSQLICNTNNPIKKWVNDFNRHFKK